MCENEPTSCPVCSSDNIDFDENMDGFISEGYNCNCNDCNSEWEINIEITENITHRGI